MFPTALRGVLACLFMAQAPVLADEGVAYTGRVEAVNRVEVSTWIDGVVTEIHFEPGEVVEQGRLLFSLDRLDFEQNRRAALASVQRTEALLEEAQEVFDRNAELRERGAIPQAQFLKSRAALAIATAARAEAESRLEAAEIALSRTRVHAPFSGIVSPARISRGSYIETGRKGVLTTIVQLDPVRIAYDIPYPERLMELGISSLDSIEDYAASVDLVVELAPGWQHPDLAEPTHLSADVSAATRSITAWALVANPTHTLRPGMEVTVRPVTADRPRKP